MAASKVTLQSASTPWVRTTASEVHSQQSLVRAARHDPRTELARFGHTHVTRAALRCPCVPGGLCSNDEPAAHLAAAQLRVERSLFPRLTRATAWQRGSPARGSRGLAPWADRHRGLSKPWLRNARLEASTRRRIAIEPRAAAGRRRAAGMALCRARVARCALAAGLPAPRWTGDVKRGSIELRLRPRVAARGMSLPTPHHSLSPARLVRAAGTGEAAAHRAPPCV